MSVRIYDAASADAIPWPAGFDGDYARGFLRPLLRDGVAAHVRNVETRLEVLVAGSLVLPLTVNATEYETSYVASPYTHYVSYNLEEIGRYGELPCRGLLRSVVRLLGAFLRAGRINRTVHVNNWLLSTNLYPQIPRATLDEILRALRQRFPDHAIAFRSINPATNPELAADLRASGCRLVTSRRVYRVAAGDRRPFVTTSYKRDLKRLRESGYRVEGSEALTPEDAPRLVELYDALYVDKYSELNPRFTPRFVENALENGTLVFRVLRREGIIDGVVGFFYRNGVMTTPFLGYDTALPQSLGLYRMLSTVLLHEARDRGLLLNQSSGAGHFKRSRGAAAGAEYTAVDTRHLPARQRWAWKLVEVVANRIAAPLMERYKL